MKTCPWNEELVWICQMGEWVRAYLETSTALSVLWLLPQQHCPGSCHLVLPTAATSLTAWHNNTSTKHWQKSNTWKLASSFSPEDCESSVTCVNICTCRVCTLTVVISMAVHLKVHVGAAALGSWRLTTIYHCVVYTLHSEYIINIKCFYFPWHCDITVCFSLDILWVMNSLY